MQLDGPPDGPLLTRTGMEDETDKKKARMERVICMWHTTPSFLAQQFEKGLHIYWGIKAFLAKMTFKATVSK